MAMAKANFEDILDPTFERIMDEEYNQHPDMIPEFYDMVPHNGREDMKWSGISTLQNFQQFVGTVQMQEQAQMYDVTATYLPWTNGFELERELIDDDQYNIWEGKPRALAASAYRTRQTHGARMFNRAFSVDTLFYNNTEGTALCSNSHTTTTGASTASGFDNLVTTAMSATAVASARIQMTQFRGTQAEIIQTMPNALLFAPGDYERAFEIVNSTNKLDTANNNANVHQGRYSLFEWNFLSDANNWFMMDMTRLKQDLKWVDRIELEYGFAEDFLTFVAMYRAYMRYANAWCDWRGILGAQVS